MKLSSFVLLILVISGIFFIFATMTDEANSLYGQGSAYINNSEWHDKYDYTKSLNSTVSPLQSKLNDLSNNPDSGFFSKIGNGIVAIYYVVLLVPAAIWNSLIYAGAIVGGFLTAFSLPAKIITIITVGMLIWAVFKLIGFLQRQEV